MTRPRTPAAGRPLHRPGSMRIDVARCIHCGSCLEIAPAIRRDPERILVSAATLDAMAACPVGAIVWHEIGEGLATAED